MQHHNAIQGDFLPQKGKKKKSGYQMDNRKRAHSGLKCHTLQFHLPVTLVSGGWRKTRRHSSVIAEQGVGGRNVLG